MPGSTSFPLGFSGRYSRIRAALSSWTMEGMDRLLDTPDGASLLRSGEGEYLDFWQALEERGDVAGHQMATDSMDAPVVHLGVDEPEPGAALASSTALPDTTPAPTSQSQVEVGQRLTPRITAITYMPCAWQDTMAESQ
mgnify:CR=1 FL=1